MKKFLFSVLGGLLIGGVLSFFLWDYSAPTFEVINDNGENYSITELDFDFVFNASLLILAFSVLLYVIWTLVDKKKDKKFLAEFERDKKSGG